MPDSADDFKADLLAEIDQGWARLHAAFASLSEAQMTTVYDQEGWAVKDHLTHVSAWENSVISFLKGRPRSEGLGVDEAFYSQASFDDINAVIKKQNGHLSADEAVTSMQATHRQLLDALVRLSDDALTQPLAAFLPSSPAADKRKAIDLIRDNTSAHYSEHAGWIETLTRGGAG